MVAGALGLLSLYASVSLAGPLAPAQQNAHASVDAAGRLHTVTASEVTGKSVLVYQVLDPLALKSLSETVLLRESTSRIRRPQIVVDSQGGVHVLWQERFAKVQGARDAQGTWVHYVRFNNGEIAEGIQHRVLNNRPQALHPNLAVDGGGNAVVVWEEDSALVVSRVVSAGLVSVGRVAVEPSSLDRRAFPAIVTDRQGQIHLAWTDHSTNGSDRMVYAVLNAQTLSPQIEPQTLRTINGIYAQRKSLAVEPSGSLRLTWTEKTGPGRLSERSDSNRLWIASGGPTDALVSTFGLADEHLHHGPVPVTLGAWVAVPSRDPWMLALPSSEVGYVLVPLRTEAVGAPASSEIEQELRREILAFASWSGPPPGRSISVSSSSEVPVLAPRVRGLFDSHPYLSFQSENSHVTNRTTVGPALFPVGAKFIS